MSTAPVEPPLALTGESTTYWFEIHNISRHATDTKKLVIVGKETSGTEVDVGILDRTTGVITVHSNMFTTANARGAYTSCGGVQCNPATGIYVVLQNNQGSNNEYPAYWTDDITADSWTLCTYNGFNTRFSGPGGLYYDPELALWWWFGNNTYESTDGKVWHIGQQDYGQASYPGGNNMTQCFAYEHAGLFNPQPGVAWFAGNTERPTSARNAGLAAAPINYEDVWAGQLIDFSGNTGVIIANNPGMNGGVVVDDSGDYVVQTTTNGVIIYTDTGAWEDWTVAAKNQAGSVASEWENGTVGNAMGVGLFCQVNGVYWAPSGNGGTDKWWRYGTGGLPIGTGWVQDSTGPFLNVTVRGGSHLHRDPHGCRLAYAGYKSPSLWYQQYVFYDEGDL